MAFTGLPVNGVEDSLDMAFFKKNTLPLIKAAIRDYLSTIVIEVPPPSAGTLLVRSTTSTLTKVTLFQYFNLLLFRKINNCNFRKCGFAACFITCWIDRNWASLCLRNVCPIYWILRAQEMPICWRSCNGNVRKLILVFAICGIPLTWNWVNKSRFFK